MQREIPEIRMRSQYSHLTQDLWKVRGTYRYYRNLYTESQLIEKVLVRTRHSDRVQKGGVTTGIGVLITSRNSIDFSRRYSSTQNALAIECIGSGFNSIYERIAI